jgi:peptidoglycan/LPS O-acetylase OafA/YrhL
MPAPLRGADSRNLDLLRAIAVGCVFAAHLILQLIDVHFVHVSDYEKWKVWLNELGHVGVLFFFVHTALVLMLSLERTKARHLVLNFYLRRIFRIYPLCIATILAVLLFRIPQVPAGQYVAWGWNEIASNLLLVQNIARLPDMIMPLWTLPREFQMYLVLPFIYLALRRIPSSLFVLILWFAFFAAVPSTPLLSCFPCFMAGVFAYQLSKERVFRLPAVMWPMAVAGLFALHVLAVLTLFNDYRSDYVLCMFVGGVIPNVLELQEAWWTRAAQTVAKYSYGIYLCHDPILWFAFVKLNWLPAAIQWSVLIGLMALVPVAAHRLLESPMIDTGRRLAARWTVHESSEAVLAEAPGV